MAQAILVQEQALANVQTRVQELERLLAERSAGGGFLSGLFGGARSGGHLRRGSRWRRSMMAGRHPGEVPAMGRPGARGQVVAFLPVPRRRRLAWPAACSGRRALKRLRQWRGSRDPLGRGCQRHGRGGRAGAAVAAGPRKKGRREGRPTERSTWKQCDGSNTRWPAAASGQS
jgi:hypothetical protein